MPHFTKYVCFYKLDDNNALILNTLTSAIDIIDSNTLAKIQEMIDGRQQITNENDYPLFSALKKRGYIFDKQQDEQNMLDYFQQANRKILSETIHTDFKICPTMGCNLRCTYCYEEHQQHGNCDLMTDELLDTIFGYIDNCNNIVKKYPNNNQIRIGLFGGEPLLIKNYQVVKKVLEFTEQIETRLYITTNGTTIDTFHDLLEQHKNNIAIQITLDGNKSDHDKRRIRADGSGTFDNVCEGIQKVLDLGIRLNVRINIDRENIYGITELKELFEKRGWNKNDLLKTYATPIRSYEESETPNNTLTDSEILEVFMKNGWFGEKDSFVNRMDSSVFDAALRLFNTPSKQKGITPWQITYCGASQGSNCCFTPDGTISTCLRCVGKKEYSIGTFDETGINIDRDRLNIWTKRDPFKMSKCKECKFILLCSGGCPFYSLKNYGDINCSVCNDIEKTLEVYVKHIKNRF